MKIRVAFTLIGGKNWTGGYNYLLNLMQVLVDEVPDVITPVLFVGNDLSPAELAPFAAIHGCELILDPIFNEVMRTKVILRGLLLGRDVALISCFQKANIDIAFESGTFLGWRLPFPSIAWIPDLQHRILPHLFSRLAWCRREIGFRMQIASSRTIMCSSKDTLQACERAYPGSQGRIHVVHFAVRPPPLFTDEEARAVADRYSLPESFFFMPNQFWAHKNHRLVVSALDLLRKRGKVIYVVATGRQLDPRNPNYAMSLVAEVKAIGLERQFITPGLLPNLDLMPLMQASIALLNPSLFEGWSTTVEEALAAGIPMVLSDLPVHHEQAGDKATYFDRTSASSLADVLDNFQPLPVDVRQTQRATALLAAKNNVAGFANDFVCLIQQVVCKKTYHKDIDN